MSTRIKVEMKPVATILTRIGVNKTGDVQMQLTRIVNKRITRYMPFRTGALSTKLKYIKSPTEIEVAAPYARMMYYGKVMVNSKTGKGPAFIPGVGYRYKKGTTLKATDRDLKYDTTKHPEAGPFWDRRMMASEKDAIVSDVQAYVRRRGK
ncbi:minor capsid protein [bacterium]|nr:minor capsid protein [bacterium]